MTILSVDQATHLGYAVWDDDTIIKYGAKNFANYKDRPDIKLNRIKRYVDGLIEKYKPGLVVIEGVQYQSNQFTYGQLSRLQGLLIDLCIEREQLYEVVPPTKWRTIGIVGRKRAEQKASSIQFVKDNFGLNVNDDVADAINMGYYALNHIKIEEN